MPRIRDVAHMRLHIQRVVDEFPSDRDIRERGREIIKALNNAPTNPQRLLDYLDSEMTRIGNSDTAKVRTWITEVTKPGSTESHIFIDMATLLEVGTLG